MRIIARMPDERQVNELVDSLRNMGFDREDMIITNLADKQKFHDVEEATAAGVNLTETEREGLGELKPFWSGIEELKGDVGILVAVKTSKHKVTEISSLMEQFGAVEIIRD